MKKTTTKSLVIEAHRANPTFDPSQISEVLKAKNIFASPSYTDQCIRDYKEKAEQLGIDLEKPSNLTFEKIDDNPEKTKQVQDTITKTATETTEKEKPKQIKAKIKEPTEQDIKNLQKAASTPTKEVITALASGKLSKEHLKSIIKIENYVLKKVANYEHDEATVDLLAEVWEKPLAKYFDKIQEENMLLYIAIGTTIIAHIPVIINLAEKYHLLDKLGLGTKESTKNVSGQSENRTEKPQPTNIKVT